ncbi:BnaA02g17030D [Brassica napus]|uniref:BnaA02g17030D protein n=1 Tax=Brassica napus TaxID=3708 RepID=A0A078IA40_BRANA|nr:BnaA06g14830D [Brassica napus]CDY46023.1 BnaA02g17030D [Brassica napus]
MLLDTVATSIIGDKVVELWDRSYDDIEDQDIPIQNMVGKSFCFRLSITADNVTNGSATFKFVVWLFCFMLFLEFLDFVWISFFSILFI